MKIDFHVHTVYSPDGLITLEDIGAILNQNDRVVDAIAITDHNTAEGALQLKIHYKDNIIVGEEVDTGDGEVIGYWLSQTIKSGLGIDKTIEEIKKQNGKVAIPHPFDLFRKKRMKTVNLDAIIDKIDMLEVFNSRNLLNFSDSRSKEFASRHRMLLTAGSDAHYKSEIGNACVDCINLNSVDRPYQVCDALKSGIITGKRCNILYHVKTKLLKLGITTKPK